MDMIGGGRGRRRGLTGAYYWFPVPGEGSVTWQVLTCHDLGRDAEVGHIDLWPAVIDRLAEAWREHAGRLRRRLRDAYSGLPRGRVTRPGGRSLVLHGQDAPVSDWVSRVILRFDLDRRSVRVVFDEHERMLPADRRRVAEALVLRSNTAGGEVKREASPPEGRDRP
jgi:hypothetical protein